MKASLPYATSAATLLGLLVGVLFVGACSSSSPSMTTGSGGTGVGDAADTAGADGNKDTGTPGSGGAGLADAAGTGGTTAADTGAADLSDAGDSGTTDAAVEASAIDADAAATDVIPSDATDATIAALTTLAPTAGCGQAPGLAPGLAVRGTIQTTGTKPPGCSDSKCGAWSYVREYFVTLPLNYLNTKAYPLVIQGPGCGGTGTNVYSLNNSVDQTVIRVGLSPPPNEIGHATNPNQGCFDDKEGDDSVDWVLYEALYDKLAAQLCFDRNRVFVSGNSSGAWFANELICKYAGDAARPVRGILAHTGGLPTQPQYLPTCSDKPMAGMWAGSNYEAGGPPTAFYGSKYAIARAMRVNECTVGTNFDNTLFDDFPIGGGNADATCKKIRGCPELYPLVACPLPGSSLSNNDSVVNPGFSTFLKLFSAPPLLTP